MHRENMRMHVVCTLEIVAHRLDMVFCIELTRQRGTRNNHPLSTFTATKERVGLGIEMLQFADCEFMKCFLCSNAFKVT